MAQLTRNLSDLPLSARNGFGIAFHNPRLYVNAMKAIFGSATGLAMAILTVAFPAHANFPPGFAVAWGSNSNGQTNVPGGLVNISAVAAGDAHSVALQSDGRVVVWGQYRNINVDGGAWRPFFTPPDLTNAVSIAAGSAHCLAVRNNGTVIGWGDNYFGQSGMPAGGLPTGITNAVAVAGGRNFSLVLRANGTVVAWGDNNNGQTTIPAGLANVVAIAAGPLYSLALKADGTVASWGFYARPSVPQDLTNVVAIAAGPGHCLALKNNGTVVAWGGNSDGQTNVPPGLSNVVAIAAGGSGSMAVTAGGIVVAWGSASQDLTKIPSSVLIGSGIACGNAHNLAISLLPLVWPSPPSATIISNGASANLDISVWSGTPFVCEWSLNGQSLAGETSTNISVSNFDISKAGAYVIAISNQHSRVTAVTVLRLANSPVISVDGVDVGGGKVDRVDSAQIVMTNTGSGAAIYFTLDGSAPDFTDIPYTGPFTLTNSATIRAIAYNFAFTESAEAAPISVQVWPTYPLSATTPGGGSIGLAPAPYSAGNRYVSNTVVTLTATPANNWSFLGWTGDSSATSNVTSVLMDRARTVTGVFGTALNLFTNGSGQVQLNPPTGPYAFGSTVKLAALPAAGYYFFGWANAASGFGNPLTFTVTNAAGITANFGALAGNQVSLVILPNGNGTVSVSPAKNVYTNSESVTLTAWPAANQTFTGWSGDASGHLNPLVVTLTSSQLITANFAPGVPTNPPVITQPPLSRTLSAGADTLLSFALTGDGPFAYQWRLNQTPISGATNPTLNLVGVTPADAGRYEIAVIGPGGAVTSAPAAVALFGMQLIPSGGAPLPLLILDGPIGTQYRLETSPNISFSNWSLLAPLTLPSSRFYYADTTSSNQPARFYRALPQ